jgi:DNA polymerase V
MESYSIDEIFAELSDMPVKELEELAIQVRSRIKRCTGITVSVGIAPTKTLAKIATRMAKSASCSSGIFLLVEDDAISNCLTQFPVDNIWGIGPSHGWNLHRQKITTAAQLMQMEDKWIRDRLTILGLRTVWELRGISCLPICSNAKPREQVIVCRTFSKEVSDISTLRAAISAFTVRGAERLRRDKLNTSCVAVFIETNRYRKDQPQIHSEVSLDLEVPTSSSADLLFYSLEALKQVYQQGYGYKKAGVCFLKLASERYLQETLFADPVTTERSSRIMSAIDLLNHETPGSIKFGAEIGAEAVRGKAEVLSRRYTTRWSEIAEACC